MKICTTPDLTQFNINGFVSWKITVRHTIDVYHTSHNIFSSTIGFGQWRDLPAKTPGIWHMWIYQAAVGPAKPLPLSGQGI
jgi:hypothetical protein